MTLNNKLKRICLFCGAMPGADQGFSLATVRMGQELVQAGYELVYGGGKVGLMGVLADAVLAEGGKAIGVIPESLVAKELAHKGLTELHIVKTMHERKALMERLSDGFIALPGGFGTLDELCEILTWSQLGMHEKPVAMLNAGGFFDKLIDFFDHSSKSGFIPQGHRQSLIISESPAEILGQMRDYQYVAVSKWISGKDI